MISPAAYFNYFPSHQMPGFLSWTSLNPCWRLKISRYFLLNSLSPHPVELSRTRMLFFLLFPIFCLKSEVELLDGVLATVVLSLTAGWTPHLLSDNGSASVHSAVSLTSPSPPRCLQRPRLSSPNVTQCAFKRRDGWWIEGGGQPRWGGMKAALLFTKGPAERRRAIVL